MARSVEKTTTVTISREIHHEFKVLCAQLRIHQKDVIDRLVQDWMKKQGVLDQVFTEKED